MFTTAQRREITNILFPFAQRYGKPSTGEPKTYEIYLPLCTLTIKEISPQNYVVSFAEHFGDPSLKLEGRSDETFYGIRKKYTGDVDGLEVLVLEGIGAHNLTLPPAEKTLRWKDAKDERKLSLSDQVQFDRWLEYAVKALLPFRLK